VPSPSLQHRWWFLLWVLALGWVQSVGVWAAVPIKTVTPKAPAAVVKQPFSQPANSALPVNTQSSTAVTPVAETVASASASMPATPTNANPDPTPAAKAPLQARASMIDIDSKQLDYDEENNVYVATGAVKVNIEGRQATIQADRIVYDRNNNLLTAEGHVVITKNGKQTIGKYARFDLVREAVMMVNPVTVNNGIKIKSQLSLNTGQYTELEKGQIIIPSDRKKPAKQTAMPGEDLMSRMQQVEMAMDTQTLDLEGAEGQNDGATPVGEGSRFKIVSDEINITRGQDGVDDVDLVNPSVYWGKLKVARFNANKVAFNEFTNQLTYLGPELGFDPALGGTYFGPGWDFRAAGGIARFSPIASFGTAVNGSGASFKQKSAGPGVGALLHYENEYVKFNTGYNTRSDQFVGLGQVKLLTDNTRLLFSRNQNYVSGFFGEERPTWSAQVADTRKLMEWKNFELDTHTSAGWMGDNFFPNNRGRFFVAAKGPAPIDAGRIQLQAQLVNTKPLLQMGHFANLGFRAQMAASGYSTGDTYAVLRAGPTVNVNLWDRLYSNASWYSGAVSGESPFVFDTYFAGKQSVNWTNAVKVNNYLSVGMAQNLSLLKDNSQNAMLVGNQVFALIGPPEVKLNLAFDLIRRRSFFGLNYYPGAKGNKNTTVDFQRLRVFEPQNFTNPTLP
jgi:hypothetical protein